MAWRAVTDKQWKRIEPRLPKRKRNPKGGRPPIDERKCFEGILWILWTGAPWSELPERYGSKSAVHRRLTAWAEAGVLLDLWRALLDQLDDRLRISVKMSRVFGRREQAREGRARR